MMSEIVVNTILWFMYHRMKMMSSDNLLKVVGDFYHNDESAILEAKQILFDWIPETSRPSNLKRFIKRQGGSSKDKASANFADIYALLQAMQADSAVPQIKFATVSCQFPSLDIGNIDAISLYTDVLALKTEMRKLKMQNEETVTEVNEVKTENLKIAAKLDKLESSNVDVVHTSENHSATIAGMETKIDKMQEAIKETNSLPVPTTAKVINADFPDLAVANSVQPSFSAIVKKNKEFFTGKHPAAKHNEMQKYIPAYNKSKRQSTFSESEALDNEWKLVTKPNRRQPKIGKGNATGLKAVLPVSKPAEIFVSRLNPETTEDEVKSYAMEQFKDAKEVTCVRIPTKYPTYASFKVSISGIPFKESVNVEKWPLGILVKRYFAPNMQNSDDKLSVNATPDEAGKSK